MAEVLAPQPAAAEQQQPLAQEPSAESADAQCTLQVGGDDKHEQQQQRPEPVSRGIYVVRCPYPERTSNAELAKLDAEKNACFTKLKALNDKFNVKKGEANELRKQLSVARSLRNGSSPEFDEKMGRLKQLRDLRKSYLDKISDHKAGRAGLECRTEEELDERIAEIEHAIQHEGLSLTEEKAQVKQISKLRAQRDRVRQFQGAQEGLGQLEAEAKKLKAVIDEVEGEVNILRGERSEAKDIIDDLSKKLAAVTAVLDEYALERQDIEATKRELQEQIKALREENDAAMFEWRANRKLGVTIRDMVTEGKLEEARQMAAEQVETYMHKLQTDKAYRQEYLKLWKDQRKYLVSELLPNSGTVEGGAAKGNAAPAGRGAPGGKSSAAPLVPQGKAKAEALIAAALQEASAAIAAKRLAEPQRAPAEPEPEPSSEEGGEQEGEEAPAAPEPPARRIVPGASEELTAVRKPKAAKASAAQRQLLAEQVQLADIPDIEYVPPTEAAKPGRAAPELSAEQQKAKLREQQRKLAEEAEERKKRRAEAAAKKTAARQKAAAEAAVAAAKAAKAANRAAALAAAAAAEEADAAAATTDNEEGEEGEHAAAAAASHHGHGHQRKRGGKGGAAAAAAASSSAAAAQLGGAGALPKKVLRKPAKRQEWYQEYGPHLAVAIFVTVLLVLLVLALGGSK